MNARCQDAELPPVTRLGQGEVANMEVDVEQVIVHHVRIAESERYLDDFPAKRRRNIEPAFDMPDDVAETEALPLHRRLVVDVEHRAMRCRMGTIHVEEHGVLAIQFSNHRRHSQGTAIY
ncbi:hypothetical protein D3C81_920000 [compost metagenome]